jgi:DNA-binding MarR family transcriptional regulator
VVTYYEIIHVIERLHRLSLEVLKRELDRLGIQGINNVQSLILYSIGGDQLTVRELTQRGYYLGSNVSYNLQRMVEAGYLLHERSLRDRRSVRISVSPEGAALQAKLDDFFKSSGRLMPKHGMEPDTLAYLGDKLSKLEAYWSSAHMSRLG